MGEERREETVDVLGKGGDCVQFGTRGGRVIEDLEDLGATFIEFLG